MRPRRILLNALLRPKVILPLVIVIVALCLPPPVHAQQVVHVVRRGENLTRIAAYYGTSVQAITRANGLRNPNYIWVGQRLVIPRRGGGGGGWVGGCGCVHIVRWGETLSQIAWRYGTSVWVITQQNGLRNPNYIWAGQRLCVPCGGYTPPPHGYTPPPCGVTHVVRWGDTLYSIARRYGTCVQTISRANGLWNPNYIWAGQRLYIPCGVDP
jgi:LysM repeat protein